MSKSVSDTLLAAGYEFIAGQMLFKSSQKWLMVNDLDSRSPSRAVFLPYLMLCLRSDIFGCFLLSWELHLWAGWRPSVVCRTCLGSASTGLLRAWCHKAVELWGPKDSVAGAAIRSKDVFCQQSSWLWEWDRFVIPWIDWMSPSITRALPAELC